MPLKKYDNIDLSVAENGFVLSYSELYKKPGKQSSDMWENTRREYKKEVYGFKDGDKALRRMVELASDSNKNAAESLKVVAEG